jgi:hypothetical protein
MNLLLSRQHTTQLSHTGSLVNILRYYKGETLGVSKSKVKTNSPSFPVRVSVSGLKSRLPAIERAVTI